MPYREIPLKPDQCFHIYNHANGFENIFVKEENYEYFLKLYIKYINVADQPYFVNLIHYIHYNPVYHGFSAKTIDWPFTSFQSISSNKPTRLLRDEVLESFGGLHQYLKTHQSPPKLILEW